MEVFTRLRRPQNLNKDIYYIIMSSWFEIIGSPVLPTTSGIIPIRPSVHLPHQQFIHFPVISLTNQSFTWLSVGKDGWEKFQTEMRAAVYVIKYLIV